MSYGRQYDVQLEPGRGYKALSAERLSHPTIGEQNALNKGNGR